MSLALTLKLNPEAEQVIRKFMGEVDRKIDELGFKIDVKRKNEILSNIEVYFKLNSVKLARKRGANIVDVVDAENALKRVNPTRVVKHALVDPQTFKQAETQEAKYFDLLKSKLESSFKTVLLDAGCGWGRQLIGYRKRGLKGEFVAFDIDKDSVRLGKTLDRSVHFLVADIQRMPFKSSSFDVVLCVAVINFVRRKGAYKVIKEFKRVLKPRGLLHLYGFFTTSHILTSVLNILTNILMKISPEEDNFSFYTLNRIQKLFFENGFTDVKMEKGFLTIIPCPFGHSEIITATMGK